MLAAGGGKAMAYKTKFCRTHAIPARLFNALACDLQGLLDGTRELLKERRKDLTKALARQKKQLATRRERLAEVARDRLRLAPARLHKLKRQAHANTVAIARLESKLKAVEARLAAKVPGICFGTAKLFRQQFHLELTSHADREAWQAAWHHARSHQVFFLGSKGETAGNQLCQLLPAENGQFRLKIRLPDCMLADGEPKYLVIDDVDFAYDRPAIERALAENVALSWRLHRDERGWRVFVAFNHPAAEPTTLSVQHGAVGVDFNVDHLAVTETDLYGNMLRTLRLPLLREDATSGLREAVLSDALSHAVRLARDAGKPLVAEDLDFSAKKKALGQASPKAARMLSGLLYAKYRQQLAAKCHRAGVELILINPAYTSTIAAVKYAARRGWSVHAAAAGVIARRGQKLSERLPRAGT
ncbi:IS200/IS605 family accessory protein TnpB-related protein [Cupriavidus basilensis]